MSSSATDDTYVRECDRRTHERGHSIILHKQLPQAFLKIAPLTVGAAKMTVFAPREDRQTKIPQPKFVQLALLLAVYWYVDAFTQGSEGYREEVAQGSRFAWRPRSIPVGLTLDRAAEAQRRLAGTMWRGRRGNELALVRPRGANSGRAQWEAQ